MGYFTIEVFLKENFHLFTIIGVVGTMIALLPTLGEKILGIDWISGDLGVLSILFVFLFIFGGLFLWGVFVILFLKIWRFHNDEESEFKDKFFSRWKKGDGSRLLLTSCLAFVMVAVVGFILFSVFMIPNPYAQITAIIFFLFSIFALPIYTIKYLMWKDILIFFRWICSKYKNVPCWVLTLGSIIIILIIFIAFVGVLSYFIPPPQDNREYPIDPKINLDEQFLIVGNSPSPILKFKAINTSLNSYKLHSEIWTASYGYFVDVKQPSSQIIVLGNPAKNIDNSLINDNTMYWTFSKNQSQIEKIPLVIHLNIVNFTTYEAISNDSLTIYWNNDDVAITNQSLNKFSNINNSV